jgi:predicted O-methyltransferase YrrM
VIDSRLTRRHFQYDRGLLVNSRLREVEEGVSDIETAAKRSGLSIGYPGWNLLYYTAFCSLSVDHYNLILETGTNWGFSTICLAQALRDSALPGRVITVETSSEHVGKAEDNLARAGLLELVEMHHMDSLSLLKSEAAADWRVRFAFLDSNHECGHLLQEFELLYPKLEDTAIVFFDNTAPQLTGQEAHVHLALKELVVQFGGNLVNFPNTSWYTPGQAVWQKRPFL